MTTRSNQIRLVLLTNLLALGLAACSSTPAPWSRPDNSPWSDKRSAESNAAPVNDIVIEAPVYEPASLPDPEPVFEADSEAFEVPPPSGYQAQSVISDINNEQRIMSLPGDHFAVQAYAAETLDSVEKFKAKHGLDNMMAVETDLKGKSIYVLVESHETRAAAQAAAVKVQATIRSKPWVRSVAGLQKVVKQ